MISIPEGYTSDIIAYNNPLISLPPIKSLDNKKDTTLLQMALKSLIKQRLFGQIVQFSKQNTQNKNHMKNKRFSLDTNFQQTQGDRQQQGLIRNKYKALNRYRGYQTPSKKQSEVYWQKNKNTISNNYDQYLKNGTLNPGKRTNRTKKFISLDKIKYAAKTDFDRKNYDNQGNPQLLSVKQKINSPSFISAIQQNGYEVRRQQNSSFNIHKQSFTLPALSKFQKKNVNIKKAKGIDKILFKKELQKKTFVNDLFWQFLCENQNKNSQIVGDLTNRGSQVKVSTILQMNGKKNIKKPKYLSKDNFNQFLKVKDIHISSLTNHIIQFFQINYKIIDRMKKQEFQEIFSNLANVNQRIWATCLFRFFDKDKNGQIDSSDLFYLFTHLDNLKNQIQSLPEKKTQTVYLIQQNQSIRLNTRRQNTQLSDISKKQSKLKSNKKSKITEISKLLSSTQPEKLDRKVKMQQNIKDINILLETINLFNKIIVKMPINNDKSRQQNEQNDHLTKSDRQKSLYLQQALLNRTQLKASDLHLIIKQSDSATDNHKRKVIEIDHSKIKVKLSSAYVQTFVATDHNDQTRMNRQYLEGLKDSIKKLKSRSSLQKDHQMNKRLKGISYKDFYQNKLYQSSLNLFFSAFRLTVVDPKS